MAGYWQRYLDGNPAYLARNYWWAYLSPLGVWFFGHRLIVNLILYGQYRSILRALCARLTAEPCGRTLQISCAYGEISPTLAGLTDELHLMDVALIQLRAAQKHLHSRRQTARLARMNAESLAYASHCFDTIVIFFLLHELPVDARQHVLDEALRVLKPGGRLFITDYAPNQGRHALHCALWTRLCEKLEPFLHEFWFSDLATQLAQQAAKQHRQLQPVGTSWVFGKFYRVEEYRG